jgi:putative ABC transport system permease protein
MDIIPFLLIILVGIVTLVIIILALKNRIVFKMAVNNFTRRKAQSVIVIAGLMIGTSIISASLVVQDTISYGSEITVFQSLGEIDEDIWGLNQYGTVVYFNESIYKTISINLSTVSDIEAIAPVIYELGSVLDTDTSLGEPRASLLGLDSQILRTTVFGDLDDRGFYPDSLGENEVAINSRLADEMDASVGDTIQLSYGAKNLSNPQIPDFQQTTLTIRKIIKERDLYGKANYNQQKTVFFELDVLQQLLNRPNEINHIWISNKGDHIEGEGYTENVDYKIEEELDKAVGMQDIGFELVNYFDALTLTSTQGYFPIWQADTLIDKAEEYNGIISFGLSVPIIAVNGISIEYLMVMGGESDEENFPTIEQDTIYFLEPHATNLGVTNNSMVTITSIRLDGVISSTQLRAYVLAPEFERPIPEEMTAMIMGFVDFQTSQLMLHGGAYEDDMASVVAVSDLDNDTLELIRAATIAKMDNDLGGEELNLEVNNVKADSLEAARTGSEGIGIMFIILGSFSIIAGIVLIINIFVMLGEERKSEMGMARAIGMKTKHLVRMYVFEGSLYAFLAAFIGAFLGLFFGWIIIQVFAYIFGSFEEFGEGAFNIVFHFTLTSVVIAFCAGLLITFATILFISTRITKLNIIRAIRRIPEPQTTRTKERIYYAGAGLLVLGILFCLGGFSSEAGSAWIIGVSLVFIGAAMVVHKWVSFRAAITVASILIIFFMLAPIDIPLMSDADFTGADSFVLSGVFLVLAGVFLVMFNSDILLTALQRTIGRSKSTRAVLKTAISYPMNSRFKTGMTLGMFALIIFTVTVIAMFASIMASQNDAMLEEQSGGYDIMGMTNPTTPFENLSKDTLPSELQEYDIKQLETMSSAYISVLDYDKADSTFNDFGMPYPMPVEQYQLLGVSDTFLSNNGFTLLDRDERYKTDREAWEALNENSSYCIVDGSMLGYSEETEAMELIVKAAHVGGTITITDMAGQNRTRVLTVIGIMDQLFFFQGILLKKDVVNNEYGGVDSLIVIELGEGEDTDAVAKAFEKHYLELGLQTSDLVGTINALISVMKNFMYLMEGFLGIGLLVGIAGIGIISYRNVIERRQQIGMLRAIGFKKGMIAKSVLIETSFITIIAIVIGILLGIGIGWQMYNDAFKEAGSKFVIPWMNLLAISLIAYFATVIFTFYPSIQASKIPPAEALRYVE